MKIRDLINTTFSRVKNTLKRLSFKTGLIILLLCVPFYIISFTQMALDLSYTLKGVLWIIFFGLAKLCQYTGLAIIGLEGVKRIKTWWNKIRKKEISID